VSGVQVVNGVIWAVGIALLLWMLFDAVLVEVRYDSDLLVSAGEGEIEREPLGSVGSEAADARAGR
jgi:hypothetical protein